MSAFIGLLLVVLLIAYSHWMAKTLPAAKQPLLQGDYYYPLSGGRFCRYCGQPQTKGLTGKWVNSGIPNDYMCKVEHHD